MKRFTSFLLLLFVGVVLSVSTVSAEEENTSHLSDKRLDQILDKQDQILKSLNELKQEIQVVKVRASNN